MTTELLKFKIGISGTFWDKRPEFSISVNDTVYSAGVISADSGTTEYFEFSVNLGEGKNSLNICLLNKTDSDVQKDNYDDPDTFKIIGDMLLNIHSIEIDDIDVGILRHTASEYVLSVPQTHDNTTIASMKECVNLGWNGTYKFAFGSPFYVWLLENM
jgi:hypothetical protein